MGSTGGEINSVNSGRVRIDNDKNRLIVNNGSTDILLAGEDSSGNIVFKVAQSGYDVKSATDQQLAFSSAFNSFKIISKQTIVVNKAANSTGTETNYTHNLGYIPCAIGYVYTNSASFAGTWPVPWHQISTGASISISGSFYMNMTSSVLQCGVRVPSGGSDYTSSFTATFVIYILAETAS